MIDTAHAVHLEGGEGGIVDGIIRCVVRARTSGNINIAKGWELGEGIQPNCTPGSAPDICPASSMRVNVKLHATEARQAPAVNDLAHLQGIRALVGNERRRMLKQ